MKKLMKVFAILVLILVVGVVILIFSIGNIVERVVPTVGSSVLGVPVSIGNVSVRPLVGKITIKNLIVGNPEGFHADHAFKLGRLTVDLDLKSAFSDKIIIHKILIDAPEITYEMGLKGSNLGALQDLIAGETKSETPPEPTVEPKEHPEKADAPSKTVAISELVIQSGVINLSAIALGGSAIPIPLPTLEMKDIGKNEGGASIPDVIEAILAKVLYAATGLVKGAGNLLGKGANLTGALAADTVKVGADVATKTLKVGVDVAGKTVEAGADLAVDAAGTAINLVGDGAVGKGAGKAAEELGKQSKKLLGGLKGILGKEENEKGD